MTVAENAVTVAKPFTDLIVVNAMITTLQGIVQIAPRDQFMTAPTNYSNPTWPLVNSSGFFISKTILSIKYPFLSLDYLSKKTTIWGHQ